MVHGRAQLQVLILDDEECIRDITRKLLEEHGYKVDTASNVTETVHLFASASDRHEPYSAVILDLTIPGGGGALEVLPLLRQIDPHVKAILISGSHDRPEMLRPRQYGFCAGLSKPFEISELRRLMKRIVSSPQDVKRPV